MSKKPVRVKKRRVGKSRGRTVATLEVGDEIRLSRKGEYQLLNEAGRTIVRRIAGRIVVRRIG